MVAKPEKKEGEDAPEEGTTFYEQYQTPAGWLKVDDCVYVRSDEDKPYIAKIEKMWTDKK